MKMRLTKKQINTLLDSIDFTLLYKIATDPFFSVDFYFIDLLHLKQYIEKEVNLNAKKIK